MPKASKSKAPKFDIREPIRQHVVRVNRPHLAQEYCDSNREGTEIDSITRGLLPHARMCAEGRTRPHVKARVEAARERLLRDEAKRSTRAAWDASEAGVT